MPDPALLIFDDGYDLSPLTDLLAGFELRTGAMLTAVRISRQLQRPIAALWVPSNMASLVGERWSVPVNRLPGAASDSYLLVNGRCGAVPAGLAGASHAECFVDARGGLIAACLDRAGTEAFLEHRVLPTGVASRRVSADLITQPWQVFDHVRRNLPGDLAACGQPVFRGSPHVCVTGDHAVRLSPTARVSPMVVLDAAAGDIVIAEQVVIEPFVSLQGPCYVGPCTTLVAHAHIRPFTVIGPQCKIGGEVSASVIHGQSNKSHFGYLGNSLVGRWVNLGAGTTTSNLKNTYGSVAMRTRADVAALDTGLQSLGSIIGDHVKTAIGTRLMTGSCIGTGAMVAVSDYSPKCVERFAFLTDRAADRYQFDKFCEVAGRMMQRREAKLSPAEAERLAQLYSAIRV
ncbi:MAG: hypothetical protein WC058_16515 [Phycisphaeraceae bacterium]